MRRRNMRAHRWCGVGTAILFALTVTGCKTSTAPNPTEVWSWGANEVGQLGDGTTTSRAVPGLVMGVSDVVSLRAGYAHSVALTNKGAVWEWGSQFLGLSPPWAPSPCQNATSASIRCHLSPVPVLNESGSPLSDVRAIGDGFFHSLAVQTQENVVVGWGNNRHGETARLQVGPFQSEFAGRAHGPLDTVESSLTGILAVAGGGAHSVALRSGPPQLTVWAWGSNEYDQVGASSWKPCTSELDAQNFGFGCQLYQHQVAGLTDVIGIAAGGGHTVVLKTDGTVWAWGNNRSGQLGAPGLRAGSTGTPVQSMRRSPNDPWPAMIALAGVTAIAAGEEHSLALRSDGTVWAWGMGELGRLRDRHQLLF